FEDYLYTYLIPGAKDNFLKGMRLQPSLEDSIPEASRIYDQLVKLRSKYNTCMIEIKDLLFSKPLVEPLSEEVNSLLIFGMRHYQIYNFLDANRFIQKVLSLVEQA